MTEPAAIGHREPIRVQVLEKFSQLITAAFGFVAALAWNEAIKGVIEAYYGTDGGLDAKFVYAGLVTILAVIAALWIGAAAGRARRLLHREPPATPT